MCGDVMMVEGVCGCVEVVESVSEGWRMCVWVCGGRERNLWMCGRDVEGVKRWRIWGKVWNGCGDMYRDLQQCKVMSNWLRDA